MSSTTNLSYVCQGCKKSFKLTGHLIQHLELTQIPRCLAAHEALKYTIRHSQFMPRRNPQSLTRRPPSTLGLLDKPAQESQDPLQEFSGDFFGHDYTGEDFPGFDGSDGGSENRDDDEEDSDEMAPELEKIWEPERQPVSIPEPDDDMDVDNSEDSSPPNINPLLRNLPSHRDSIHIEVFGGLAGAAVETDTSTPVFYDSEDGFQLYESQISGLQDNKWAPFASKRDWEVARWAKMRGTGSTAFSDLLSIDGVCTVTTVGQNN